MASYLLSVMKPVPNGVHQGSALGPLLFLLYVSDKSVIVYLFFNADTAALLDCFQIYVSFVEN